MRAARLAVRSLVALLIMVMLLPSDPAWASRMEIPVDTAIDTAEVIVMGRSRVVSDESRRDDRPQLIQITVEKCWKGTAKPGDRVVCVDWNPYSTAMFYFDPAGPNVVFLRNIDPKDTRAAKLGENDQKPFDIIDVKTVHDRDKLMAFARTEQRRKQYTASIARETHVLEAVQRVLDVRLVQKPADPAALWRKMLAEDANPVLLQYAAEHLPQPLPADDGALLVKTILRVPAERDAATRIYHVLAKGKYRLDGATLRAVIESGAPLSWPMSSMVDAASIEAVREPLFRRVTAADDPDYGDTGSLRALAHLAPDFAKEKLRSGKFPFDIELPLLSVLGINGSAVGRPDYPAAMLKANTSLVQQIGRMVRDPEGYFNLEFTMEHLLGPGGFRQDWQALAPLMSPLLASPDLLRRRQTVAFMRTLGYTVGQEGGIFRLDAQAGVTPLPLSAGIVAPDKPLPLGQSWAAEYTITASADHVAIAAKPQKVNWQIVEIGKESRGESSVGTDSGGWTRASKDHSAFIELKKGESTRGMYPLAANLFKSPGRYRITLSILYRDAGDEAGIDAWTGAVHAPPVEVQVAP